MIPIKIEARIDQFFRWKDQQSYINTHLPKSQTVFLGDIEFFGRLGYDVVTYSPIISLEMINHTSRYHTYNCGNKLSIMETLSSHIRFDDNFTKIFNIIVSPW